MARLHLEAERQVAIAEASGDKEQIAAARKLLRDSQGGLDRHGIKVQQRD